MIRTHQPSRSLQEYDAPHEPIVPSEEGPALEEFLPVSKVAGSLIERKQHKQSKKRKRKRMRKQKKTRCRETSSPQISQKE
jgi:hypothetical protein